ncbi:MAG TPA: hypothetical protein VFJ59_04845, partial [Pseudolabrys sp.]|nr:hypothetical protein [Pseudolabrys sp.]
AAAVAEAQAAIFPSKAATRRKRAPRGRAAALSPLADNSAAPAFVRYWSNSGQSRILARDGLSAFDPKRTLAKCPQICAGKVRNRTIAGADRLSLLETIIDQGAHIYRRVRRKTYTSFI